MGHDMKANIQPNGKIKISPSNQDELNFIRTRSKAFLLCTLPHGVDFIEFDTSDIPEEPPKPNPPKVSVRCITESFSEDVRRVIGEDGSLLSRAIRWLFRL